MEAIILRMGGITATVIVCVVLVLATISGLNKNSTTWRTMTGVPHSASAAGKSQKGWMDYGADYMEKRRQELWGLKPNTAVRPATDPTRTESAVAAPSAPVGRLVDVILPNPYQDILPLIVNGKRYQVLPGDVEYITINALKIDGEDAVSVEIEGEAGGPVTEVVASQTLVSKETGRPTFKWKF